MLGENCLFYLMIERKRKKKKKKEKKKKTTKGFVIFLHEDTVLALRCKTNCHT